MKLVGAPGHSRQGSSFARLIVLVVIIIYAICKVPTFPINVDFNTIFQQFWHEIITIVCIKRIFKFFRSHSSSNFRLFDCVIDGSGAIFFSIIAGKHILCHLWNEEERSRWDESTHKGRPQPNPSASASSNWTHLLCHSAKFSCPLRYCKLGIQNRTKRRAALGAHSRQVWCVVTDEIKENGVVIRQVIVKIDIVSHFTIRFHVFMRIDSFSGRFKFFFWWSSIKS